MNDAKFDVQPLFADPVFRMNIGDSISKKQIDYIKNLKMVQNQTNLISENLYIFDEPELKSIKDAIHEVLSIYAGTVMGIGQELFVTQSWSLINRPNVGMHGHSHSNSIVSGSLYFCDLPEPVSNMIFDRHNSYQQLQLTPLADKHNLYNTPANVVKPAKNDVILFSSDFMHRVEPNMGKTDRYSIAFNTFVRGKLGNYRDVSELTL